jgi:hypothetical protein
MTPQDKQDMIAAQNGACALCLKPFVSHACIDHCHQTGQVRGILCVGCNVALGRLGDTIEAIEGVLDYLRRANG